MHRKIAIIGTQGLPNKYGGFETLVDYLTNELNEQYNFTVFCSSKIYDEKHKSYNNSNLKYLPFNANGAESVIYDSLSLLLTIGYDKVLILGSSGAIIMPLLSIFKNKYILNFGGLDWQRSKWSPFAKKMLKYFERIAVKNSSTIVSDNKGISDYIREEYGLDSHLIEYGGDQAEKVDYNDDDLVKYPFLNKKYAFAVARIQPDNNIDMIVESFSNGSSLPLVFVGNWNHSSYGLELKKRFAENKNMYLMDAIYEQRELNILRSNCYAYIHGHSAGGTNPSLVEAMNLGLPVIAFSSIFNKHTTEDKAIYFSSKDELIDLLINLKDYDMIKISNELKEIANRRYKWEIICNKYSELFKK